MSLNGASSATLSVADCGWNGITSWQEAEKSLDNDFVKVLASGGYLCNAIAGSGELVGRTVVRGVVSNCVSKAIARNVIPIFCRWFNVREDKRRKIKDGYEKTVDFTKDSFKHTIRGTVQSFTSIVTVYRNDMTQIAGNLDSFLGNPAFIEPLLHATNPSVLAEVVSIATGNFSTPKNCMSTVIKVANVIRSFLPPSTPCNTTDERHLNCEAHPERSVTLHGWREITEWEITHSCKHKLVRLIASAGHVCNGTFGILELFGRTVAYHAVDNFISRGIAKCLIPLIAKKINVDQNKVNKIKNGYQQTLKFAKDSVDCSVLGLAQSFTSAVTVYREDKGRISQIVKAKVGVYGGNCAIKIISPNTAGTVVYLLGSSSLIVIASSVSQLFFKVIFSITESIILSNRGSRESSEVETLVPKAPSEEKLARLILEMREGHKQGVDEVRP